jgi:hypothetical protein
MGVMSEWQVCGADEIATARAGEGKNQIGYFVLDV